MGSSSYLVLKVVKVIDTGGRVAIGALLRSCKTTTSTIITVSSSTASAVCVRQRLKHILALGKELVLKSADEKSKMLLDKV
jgi:hypothetical protein